MGFYYPKKCWWVIEYQNAQGNLYIIPCCSQRKVEKMAKSLRGTYVVKPLTWSNARRFLSAVIPTGVSVGAQVKGSLGTSYQGRLVTIFPI